MKVLRKENTDVWSIASCRCPHCLETTEVLLTQTQLNFAPLWIKLFYIERSYSLTCKKCRYHKPIDAMELYGAARAKRLFGKFREGELNAEEYLEKLRKIHFPSFQSFLKSVDLWECSGCGEKSPPEMTSCWKCGALRPGYTEAADSPSTEEPPMPGPIGQSSHPWEL